MLHMSAVICMLQLCPAAPDKVFSASHVMLLLMQTTTYILMSAAVCMPILHEART